MTPCFGWKFPSFVFLAGLFLAGCGVTGQDLRQEVQDQMAGNRARMSRLEKSYESHEYFGYSSQNPDEWNTTDLTLWADTQGAGP
jgi:hypothetical protein